MLHFNSSRWDYEYVRITCSYYEQLGEPFRVSVNDLQFCQRVAIWQNCCVIIINVCFDANVTIDVLLFVGNSLKFILEENTILSIWTE